MTVPACSLGSVTMKGFCLDAELPAPGLNDYLRLRPAAEFAEPRYGGLEMDIMRYAQANPRVRYNDIQQIIWGIRGASQGSYFTQSLAHRRDLQDIIEAARPGAGRMLVQAMRDHEAKKRADENLRRMFPMLRDFEQISESLTGLADPRRSSQSIDQYMRTLNNRQVPGRAQVPPEAAFSTLQPGVYAQAMGAAPLVADVALMNLSDRPFVFNPVEWVAESQLPQQRVAFSSMDKAVAAPMKTDLGNFAPREMFLDIAKLLAEKALGLSDQDRAQQLADLLSRINKKLGGWGVNPTVKQVANALPLVGNVISAYQIFDTSLSREERVLAAFGTIPGYGSLLKVAGSANALGKIAQNVVKHAPGLAKAVDRTEWLRDIGGLATIQVTDKDEKLWQATLDVVPGLIKDWTGRD